MDAMIALKKAGVLVRERRQGRQHPFSWAINPEPGTWDLEALARIRKAQRLPKKAARKTQEGPEDPQDEETQKTPNRCLRVGTKVVSSSSDQIGATQKKGLKKDLKKTCAADAAVSFNQSQRMGEGELGKRNSPSLATAPSIEIPKPTHEELARVASLRDQLRRIGLNPDPWLSHKGRHGVRIGLVIRVLEQAAGQKTPILSFWAWAETTLAGIGEKEWEVQVEREHNQRKVEFAKTARETLEQIFLGALRKQSDGEVTD